MRILLAALLFLQLLPLAASATEGESESETVSLLVPSDAVAEDSPNVDAAPEVGWSRVEVPIEGTVEDTVEAISEDLDTEVIVENTYPLLDATTEPAFRDQWYLENTGQSGGTPDADIDAVEAWTRGDGSGIVVAVVDSGVDSSHTDLTSQVWRNPNESSNGIDDDGNALVDDLVGWDFVDNDNDPRPGTGTGDWHGTAVAGVIAAAVNGTGTTGVSPGAEIMNLKACSNGTCRSLDAARAIIYAVDAGADLINLSFGGPAPMSVGDPALQSAIDYARARNVLVVTAAGNTPPSQIPNGQIIVPAELSGANNFAVAATDRRDRMASFAYYSPRIDIAAPGAGIRTTTPSGYATVDGSSFSAAVAAGAAALLLSTDPSMGYATLAARLIGFADKPAQVIARIPAGRLNVGRATTHRFIDSVGHLFEGDIDWAATRGITKGCDPPINLSFCPNNPVSREVMAAFLARALGLPATNRDFFRDDNNSIFENDINRLAAAGITRGCGPTSFCPREVVDRGQMAAFLVRAMRLTNNGGGNLFVDDNNSIFQNDIDKLAAAGVTRGCNPPQNNRYCPGLPVDRGAMAAFLHRALD